LKVTTAAAYPLVKMFVRDGARNERKKNCLKAVVVVVVVYLVRQMMMGTR